MDVSTARLQASDRSRKDAKVIQIGTLPDPFLVLDKNNGRSGEYLMIKTTNQSVCPRSLGSSGRPALRATC